MFPFSSLVLKLVVAEQHTRAAAFLGGGKRDRYRQTDRQTETDTHTHARTYTHTHTHTHSHTHIQS